MTFQTTVGVTVRNQTNHQSSKGSQPQSQGSARRPALPQIPNHALLVSGTKLPQQPAFNSVSTGSPASDRRATEPPIAKAKTRSNSGKTVATIATGTLPQTGEVAVSCSVLIGVILLLLLGIRAVHSLRRQ